jgi:hypothetical protein
MHAIHRLATVASVCPKTGLSKAVTARKQVEYTSKMGYRSPRPVDFIGHLTTKNAIFSGQRVLRDSPIIESKI